MDNRYNVLERRQGIIAGLTSVRMDCQMTQQEVADIIGTTRSNISRMESWMIPRNRTFVHEILRSLDLDIHDTGGIVDASKGL